MTWKDQVFVADVVGTDPMREAVASNVISQPVGATAKLNAIVKICKYRSLHKGHHFILMAMEVYHAPKCYMDCFIKECAYLFHNRWLGGHLSLFFAFNFSCNMLVLLSSVL